VGRTYGNENTGISDFQSPKAMDNGNAINGEFVVHFDGDFRHFGEGHGFVGFILEVESAAAVGIVANTTIEGNDGAVSGLAELLDKRRRFDSLPRERDLVFLEDGIQVGELTSADGRQKSDLVARLDRRAPGGEFLISRSHERAAKVRDPRMAGAEMGKKLCDGGIRGDLGRFFGAANDVA
jgi:hypothetical protein